MRGQSLAEYVKRKMAAKGLSRIDIEKQSGKMITDGHVAYVLAGRAKNPTLKILLGLAKGLDVDPIEVFQAAANLEGRAAAQGVDTHTLVNLINQLADNPELTGMVLALSKQKPAETKRIKKILEID